METIELNLTALRKSYASGVTPADVLTHLYDRMEAQPLGPVWISLVPRAQAMARAEALRAMDPKSLPLYGVPFAVKDNIDVAGMETTAACPAFAYPAEATATVVQKLEQAGAILIGKTNMDQFATGLVGVRSPYGACSSVFDADYLSGGSSAGSAVATASGLVSFALGTDTAGSGRVPAAFNNLIGLKATRGALSTYGVVPACRSLDCVSIFALTCSDAWNVYEAACGLDNNDPYSRTVPETAAPWLGGTFQFGVPYQAQWEFFGDSEAQKLYAAAIEQMETLGGTRTEFDLAPFRDAAELLYAGPWVAERLAALQDFTAEHAAEMHPVVCAIVEGGAKYSAVDTYNAQYKLEALRHVTGRVWDNCDVLLLPTTGTIYSKAAVEADPVRLNSNLGYYTNFVNLLDLAAVAVPAGFRANGLPFGVSLIGEAGMERPLLGLADTLHRSSGAVLGGTGTRLADTSPLPTLETPPGCVALAVVGAHLTGQPLNNQLTERGARLMRTTRSASGYRLYALPNTSPPKPGLVRAPDFTGPGIELEVWAMPTERFGSFVALVPAPLGIGTVEMEDGTQVKGFICEPYAVQGAAEITHLGGWRAHLASQV